MGGTLQQAWLWPWDAGMVDMMGNVVDGIDGMRILFELKEDDDAEAGLRAG